jgi:hypothetical protein
VDEEVFTTIRDTPLGVCIGRVLIDITSDEREEFLADKEGKNRVYLHFDNGETIFCTAGVDGERRLGMLGTEDNDEIAEME